MIAIIKYYGWIFRFSNSAQQECSSLKSNSFNCQFFFTQKCIVCIYFCCWDLNMFSV